MSLKPRRYDLALLGRVLATRPAGRAAGVEAAARLADEDRLLLNFHGVEVASPPFLDELMVALRGVLLGGKKRWLLVTGCNEDVKESLEMVVGRQKMVLAVMKRDEVELLGSTPQLAETLEAAREMGSFTAPELAEHLKLKLPAVHQRLNALLEAGALGRVDDPTATRGKRGIYSTPPKDEVQAAAAEPDEPQLSEVITA